MKQIPFLPGNRSLIAALAICLATVAGAQDKSAATPAAKGKAAAEIVRVTATVDDIDQATRTVTLKNAQGEKVSFVAGPDVRNLAQVAKGDVVTMEYAQAVAVKLDKTPNNTRSRTVTEVADRAAVGQKPGGIVVREVKVIASVEAIDMAKNVVTLRGPEHTVAVKVQDPAMLKGVKKGDFVEAVYTEALAIKVAKGPAPAPKK
jgi:Cu/Ag efflux protein CusF